MTSGRRSVEEHEQYVGELLAVLRAGSTATVPLSRALHRTLAETISSPLDLPSFRNSQMDGYAVARELRKGKVRIPILMLTARDEEPDRIAGLEAGMRTVLVLSGITAQADVDRFPYRPTRIVGSIRELVSDIGSVD